MTSLTKKTKTKNQKIFFIADLPSLLRVWTALWHHRLASYRVAKWQEITSSMRDFYVWYIRTLAAKVLNIWV